MILSKQDCLDFVVENDVKFIRLQFCDIMGTIKNISISPSQLDYAFEYGIGFDSSSILGFNSVEMSDLFLFPDPTTLRVLPWRPQVGKVVRFLCDIKKPDGSMFEGDSRYVLKRMVQRASNMGLSFQVGPECEFYLFKVDDKDQPVLTTPHDNASYLDVAPFDKGENTRRDICLTLEEMGLMVEASHHESGFGQHEIDFRYDHVMVSADNFLTFKTVVKSIATRNGLYASFMPKPINGMSGSGLHVNMSLYQNLENLFAPLCHGEELSDIAQNFLGGIISHIKGISAISNPLVNSYKRLWSGFEAPRAITWSLQNRSNLIRVPAVATSDRSRIELRSPDPSCNPYLTFAAILGCGLQGIAQKETVPAMDAIDASSYTREELASLGIDSLPTSLWDAIGHLEKDSTLADILGEHIFKQYISLKKAEWNEYFKTVHDWEINRYFKNI
jgi:glutamine synthetase